MVVVHGTEHSVQMNTKKLVNLRVLEGSSKTVRALPLTAPEIARISQIRVKYLKLTFTNILVVGNRIAWSTTVWTIWFCLVVTIPCVRKDRSNILRHAFAVEDLLTGQSNTIVSLNQFIKQIQHVFTSPV